MAEMGFILAGFGVGALVGLTGVGGGSLMTPLLIFLFGIPPVTAVGTDLLFAAITKAGGIWSHQRQGNIRTDLLLLLGAGSLPTALLTVYYLGSLRAAGSELDGLIQVGLGIALVLTSLVLLFRRSVHRLGRMAKLWLPSWRRLRPWITVLCGMILGLLVPISSIGAGALGAAMLLFLYPRLPTRVIVGTDLAHAVPLTAVAGLGHLQMGSVDFALLGMLLAGSLPGIWLGSQASNLVPERVMRPLLASMLMLIGVKFMFVN
ncbi:MAG TPA: sulfite exporter TauE/SafE family protein [Gammaproteobacteria bacterium]|nr:sulfite exporter TauE/SafE family protein [Gammaproteobacteria bacterium]